MDFPHLHNNPIFLGSLLAGVATGVSVRRFGGDRARRDRLQALGFEPGVAFEMSAYHTKNFM